MDMINNLIGLKATLYPDNNKYSGIDLATKLLKNNQLQTSLTNTITANLSLSKQDEIFNSLDNWDTISTNVLDWFN